MNRTKLCCMIKKGKSFPYSLLSYGPGDDPGVQAVSLQVTVSHQADGRLPLLSARPVVIFPATDHHRPLANIKLYCLVTRHIGVNNLPKVVAQRCPQSRFEPATYCSHVQRCTTRCATAWYEIVICGLQCKRFYFLPHDAAMLARSWES